MNQAGSIAVGGALLLAAVAMLFWNEGRTVRTSRALDEGSRSVVSIGIDELGAQRAGTLVHSTGPLTASGPIADPILGIGFDGVMLVREVETFQYRAVEHDPEGGSSTEAFTVEWTTRPSASPTGEAARLPLPVGDTTLYGPDVRFGGLSVSQPLLARYRATAPINLTADQLYAIAVHLDLREVAVDGEYLYLPFGAGTPARPQVGDYRVKLAVVPAGVVSLVGRKTGTLLEPFTARSGTSVGIISAGVLSSAAMFETAAAENSAFSTALRFVGAGIAIGGFRLILGRILGFLGFIPLLGGAFRLGLTAVAGALGVSMAVSVIAASWLFHRPLAAMPAITVAVALGWLVLAPAVRSRRTSTPPTVNVAEATAPGR
ncbi:MAG TPA: TMEM43 family protein [Trueperaceae bacterium]|nr:TMEM43 family protein [Trueperaceae bacterium]